MTTVNTDDVNLTRQRNEQLHSFLSEEEEIFILSKLTEGAVNTKGKSKKPVAKHKVQQLTVVLDDGSD